MAEELPFEMLAEKIWLVCRQQRGKTPPEKE